MTKKFTTQITEPQDGQWTVTFTASGLNPVFAIELQKYLQNAFQQAVEASVGDVWHE